MEKEKQPCLFCKGNKLKIDSKVGKNDGMEREIINRNTPYPFDVIAVTQEVLLFLQKYITEISRSPFLKQKQERLMLGMNGLNYFKSGRLAPPAFNLRIKIIRLESY
jgi:hypothetical protein